MRTLAVLTSFQQEFFHREIKRCLDIGCNRGYFSKMVAERGCSVDALDPELDLSEVIVHPNIHYYKMGMENFVHNGKYDLILFCEVFEHIPVENRQIVLEKIHDLIAEDGILVFSGPNCFSFLYGAGYCKEKCMNFFKGTSHLNWHYHIPFFVYKNTLESSGFVLEQWCTDGVFPILLDPMEGLLGWCIEPFVSIDKLLSKIFKGFGANYYCIAKKKKKSIKLSLKIDQIT
ncbi:MAG: class I SAM-dependent methyltransferase [Methanoregula sp.]|nr:class I SAM-dependent methyltransferase [Methanoregula sp.]